MHQLKNRLAWGVGLASTALIGSAPHAAAPTGPPRQNASAASPIVLEVPTPERVFVGPAILPNLSKPARKPTGKVELMPIPTTWPDPFMLIPTKWDAEIILLDAPTTTQPAGRRNRNR